MGPDADDNLSDMEPHGDGHPALKDVDVRTAMAMAIDKEELVDKVLQGYGTPASGIVTPASAPAIYHWEPTEEEEIPFDPDGANQLLDDAGYEDTDDDGVREMPGGGEPLRFRYFIRSENDDTVKASQFIKGWFEDIGVATDVQALSDNKLTQEVLNGEYDLFHWGWFPDPDPDFILSIFTCDQRPPNPDEYRNSDSYYCNPEIDAMYEEQKTILDVEQRAELVHEMQRIIYQDVPYIVL